MSGKTDKTIVALSKAAIAVKAAEPPTPAFATGMGMIGDAAGGLYGAGADKVRGA